MNIFLDEHQKMLLTLVNHNVRFLIIGGYAVVYHGYPRTTGDMDIWLGLGNENKLNLLNAFREYGIVDEGLSELERTDFTRPDFAFSIGDEPRKMDFLTLVSNLKFEEAFAAAAHITIDGKQIPIIDFNHLILTKITSERLKDKADIEELQKINKYRKS